MNKNEKIKPSVTNPSEVSFFAANLDFSKLKQDKKPSAGLSINFLGQASARNVGQLLKNAADAVSNRVQSSTRGQQHAWNFRRVEDNAELSFAEFFSVTNRDLLKATLNAIKKNNTIELEKILTYYAGQMAEVMFEHIDQIQAEVCSAPFRWRAFLLLLTHFPQFYDVNQPFDAHHLPRQYLLHEAIYRCDMRAVQLLVNAGADLSIKVGQVGETIGHLAAYRLRADMIALLHEKGADLNACDANHSTPLHYAVQSPILSFGKLLAVVKALLSLGVDWRIKNREGQTPRQLLEQRLRQLRQSGVPGVKSLPGRCASQHVQADARQPFAFGSEIRELEAVWRYMGERACASVRNVKS